MRVIDVTNAPLKGRPYERANQIDWYGMLWSGATFVYSDCTGWDCRDWYEFV